MRRAEARAEIRAEGLLLLTAGIWGFAIVTQRIGMSHVGPFAFNGLRFVLGCLPLVPFLVQAHRAGDLTVQGRTVARGMGLGVVLFGAASLQQIGIVYTTAGKTGFITGLYVVMVPLFGIAVGQRATFGQWGGALAAAGGLYLLSMEGGLHMGLGDLLVLASAAIWALHLLLIGSLAQQIHWSLLAFLQFGTCAILSLVAAASTETLTGPALAAVAWPLLYAGFMSVGVGYTLQVVGQRHAPPAAAAIILSLEAVFAALGGWLLLGELLNTRQLSGCVLMLAGTVVAQLKSSVDREST